MPTSNATVEFNTFVRGIITEASPLTYPENASLDEQNFVLNRDGSRQRRLGIDYESGYSFTTTVATGSFSTSDNRIGSYRWDNVSNDSSLSIGVVQVLQSLYFVDLSTSSPSNNLLNGGSPVSLLAHTGPMQFTPFGGNLLVTYKAAIGTTNLISLSYDKDTDTVSYDSHELEVRDIWGVYDGLDVEERPGVWPVTITDEHRYNVNNQGWYRDDVKMYTGTNGNPADFMALFLGWPSNADIWYYGKNASDEFDPRELEKIAIGNTPAPKGHYIISPFTRGTSRRTLSPGTPGLGDDADVGSVTTIASFAGRVFYAGVAISNSSELDANAPRLESTIFFSQATDALNRIGKCYQEGDPTSEQTGDIVDTDGGTISIPEINVVYRLLPLGNQLVIFSENGVWSIRGSDEGFSATNFQVSKLTNIGVAGPGSIVEIEGGVFYWSKAGIYLLSFDEVSGELSAKNVSETTIQSLYTAIPSVGRAFAKGNYDEASRKVSWLYNDSDDYDGNTLVDRYNKELVFDLTLNAFYKNTFPESEEGPFVAGYMRTPSYLSTDNVFDIVEGADDIVEGTDDIVYTESVRGRGVSTTKYLTVRENSGGTAYEFTLSDLSNEDYLDWYTEDSVGTDAAAFLETGYFTGGDTQREKSSKYLTTHFNRTETGYELDGNNNITLTSPSSCLVQAKWDFSDSANSGRWSTQFQAYRLGRYYIPEDINDPFDYGFDVITTKNKIRGHGKALRFRFETEAGKDMYMLGWGMTISQRNNL